MRLTTDGVRPGERAEFWTDLVSRHVTPMAMEPAQLELRGEIQARTIGDVGVARVCGQGLRADIAFACGFNGLSHFGRVFAAKTDMSPSAWRKRATERFLGEGGLAQGS